MERTALFRILGDETRLRILNLLNKQDLCVCELVEILQISQPKISKHIAKIRSLKLVQTERNEQYIYYSIDRNNTLLLTILEQLSQEETTLVNDVKKLESIESFVCTRSE